MKTAITRKQKVEKSIQRCEIDRLAEGYKQAIYEIRVQTQKTDFRAKIRIFRPKKHPFLDSDHVLATTGQSCAMKHHKNCECCPGHYLSTSVH